MRLTGKIMKPREYIVNLVLLIDKLLKHRFINYVKLRLINYSSKDLLSYQRFTNMIGRRVRHVSFLLCWFK